MTTVAEKKFSGPIYEEIRSVFLQDEVIDRTTMNTSEEAHGAPWAAWCSPERDL